MDRPGNPDHNRVDLSPVETAHPVQVTSGRLLPRRLLNVGLGLAATHGLLKWSMITLLLLAGIIIAAVFLYFTYRGGGWTIDEIDALFDRVKK